MSNKFGVLGDALGQVGSLGKQVGQQVVKTPTDLAKAAVTQIGLPETVTQEKKQTSKKPKISKEEEKKQTREVVKSLYGIKSQDASSPQAPAQPDAKAQETTKKEAEDKQKLEQLRQQLHQTQYYQPLVNRPKKQEEVERPQERVERQKMEELQENDEKKKKKKPLAVARAHESTEKFRGVSG